VPFPRDEETAMWSITGWAFSPNFCLEPKVIDGLLEIHQAIRPFARHPRAHDLLRRWDGGKYLRQVGEDLQEAVRFGQLRVELLQPPQIAMEREKAPSEKPQAPPVNESIAWVAFKLVDQDGEPVPRRAFLLTGADKDERDGMLTSAGRERFERMAPGDCTLVFNDFDVNDFSEPKALPGKSSTPPTP